MIRSSSSLTKIMTFCLCISVTVVGKEKLSVDFEIGYNGVVPKTMRLVPVKIRLQNRLRNLSGRLEISQPGANGNEVTLIKRFRSTAPSTLSFTMYPRVEVASGIGGFSLKASVVFDDKSVATFSKTVHGKTDKKLVLVCGMTRLFMKNVDRSKINDDSEKIILTTDKYQYVNVATKSIPNDVYGMDSVHAVIIDGLQFTKLESRKKTVMMEWVESGGRLLIFHPIASNNLSKWIKRRNKPRVDTKEFKAMRQGIGWIVLQPHVSNRDKPFWLNHKREYVAKRFFPLMTISKENVTAMKTNDVQGSGWFEEITSNENENGSTYGIRGALGLLAIIVIYVTLIGPVDWWIMKHTRKKWISWISFAVSIGIFSVISRWYAQTAQSAPMSIVWCNLLDVKPDGGISRGNGLFRIRSTGNFDLKIESNRKECILSCKESAINDKSASAFVHIRNRDKGTSIVDCRIPIFSSKIFASTWKQKMQTIERLDDGAFKIPPDKVIISAYLANVKGIRTLKVKDDKIVLDDAKYTNWDIAIKRFSKSVGKGKNEFQAPDNLTQYCLGMSFANMCRDNENVDCLAYSASAWELSVDCSDYLTGENEILLLFVKKNLNEPRIDKEIPQRTGVDCIRYFLSRKDDAT